MKTKKSSKRMRKRMRRRERGDVLEALEIPLDLQIEILNRLPIKSLARFKCVSKLWSSLITSKGYFFASSPRLYITLVVEDIHYSPKKFVRLSLTSSTSKSNIVFDIDSTMDGIGVYEMVALRGLILYKFHRQACIYNPTTGQRVTLPAVQFNIPAGTKFLELHDYFLGYDPVLDQYKVVCTGVAGSLPRKIYPQHWWVYVLEEGSSWKKIEFDHPHIPSKKGLCINGIIYYFASSSVSRRMVISFDVRSEELNMIKVPRVVYEYFNTWDLHWDLELIEYDGKPTIFDCTHLQDPSGFLDLWILKDGGIWSKKSLVLQHFQKHLVPQSIYFKVIGTTQYGEVVLKPGKMISPYYILYYDLHKNNVRRVDIRGISEEPFALALMDTGESIMHLKI